MAPLRADRSLVIPLKTEFALLMCSQALPALLVGPEGTRLLVGPEGTGNGARLPTPRCALFLEEAELRAFPLPQIRSLLGPANSSYCSGLSPAPQDRVKPALECASSPPRDTDLGWGVTGTKPPFPASCGSCGGSAGSGCPALRAFPPDCR